MTLEEMGQKMGGRDHATMIHSKKVIEDELTYDKNLAYDVSVLQSQIDEATKEYQMEAENSIYFIDLKEFSSLMENRNRAVIMVGLTEHEQKKIAKTIGMTHKPIIKHSETPLYIIEPNKKQNEKR